MTLKFFSQLARRAEDERERQRQVARRAGQSKRLERTMQKNIAGQLKRKDR